MAAVEREKGAEYLGQKQVILFVDDDTKVLFDSFSKPLSKITDLEIKFYNPSSLFSLDDRVIENIKLIIVDQFFDNWQAKEKASGILETIQSKNSDVEIIETSYLPQPPSYQGSVGVFDTLHLIDILREGNSKTAFTLIAKLKWMANSGFQEADKVDKLNEDDGSFVKTFTNLISNFDRLTKSSQFQKLLKLLGSDKDQFCFAFMSDNDITRRKIFLHSAWQVVGHLIANNSEDYYGMSLQRLKEMIPDF